MKIRFPYFLQVFFCKFRPQGRGAPKKILSSCIPYILTYQNITILFKGRPALKDFKAKIHAKINAFMDKMVFRSTLEVYCKVVNNKFEVSNTNLKNLDIYTVENNKYILIFKCRFFQEIILSCRLILLFKRIHPLYPRRLYQ